MISLRDAIKTGLGNDWTQTREDDLFRAISPFVEKVREHRDQDLWALTKEYMDKVYKLK